ncbi:MAG: RNA polymerase factor sigma-54 [Acidobacteria bacterium]|nr:RNA polymerase factor sigma-54 [Acidobacteriota bacterium]
MALEQKLSLKLAQKLVMTPSLQQAIKLLQMTRMELQGVLAQELVENPILEEGLDAHDEEETPREEDLQQKTEKDEIDHAESMENIDLDAYFSDYWESSGYASIREDHEGPPLENTISRDPDLYDHLLWQLHMADVEPRRRQLAEMIIGNLDPDGFLVADAEEIRASAPPAVDDADARPEFELEEIEATIALVQSFDPPGIARRDLRDSLLAQLALRRRDLGIDPEAEEEDEAAVEALDESAAGEGDGDGEPDSETSAAEEPAASGAPVATLDDDPETAEVRRAFDLARILLADYWDQFLRRQYPVVAKELGVDLHDLQPAVELIKTLDPRPGRRFTSDRPQYIEPDVAVVKVGGEYVVQVNDDGMPRLRVSRAYRKMLRQMRSEGDHADAQAYIKDKIRSAMWLIKSLDQRQRTIYKVANSIVRQQQEFLDRGIEHLRPMVLRDVAEDIGMHESTVSRVVANKYIHTPRGLFPMKFFFHSGIDREYGENISSLTVKRKIENLIQDENPKKPLSDSELMRVLKREGIQIARRTVAKYRDELGIPSSTDRKKIF